MATAAQALKDEATCSVCLDYFNDPVSIDCGHSFCRACITDCNKTPGEFTCPQCRQKICRKSPRTNWQLRSIVEKFKQQQQNVCEKHQQTLMLFCEEDQAPICVVCERSEEHKTHTVKLQDWMCRLRKETEYISESKLKEEEKYNTMRDFRSTLDRCKEVMFLGAKQIKKYKVMVTLDPDTAHRGLRLSEGGRRVRQTDPAQHRPDTPKRFTTWPCVLGSEGFTSGRHYWEVQRLHEGEWGEWDVGVAVENVNRDGQLKWSPEGGVWCVERRWNGQYWALMSPDTPLFPREEPLKLGVYLDYERGQLSLYNADSMELLYSFPRAPFTHRLFPFFFLHLETELRLV